MINRLEGLKKEADELGINYSNQIGETKLEEKIEAFKANPEENPKVKKKAKRGKDVLPLGIKLTDREIAVAKAKSLSKVKVSNLDANNTGATTVTSGVFNQFMSVQRVVPLNMEIALEECLIVEIESRKSITSVPELDELGNATGNFKAVESPTYAVVRY